MPAQVSLFQEVYQQIAVVTASLKVRKTTVVRLALLVTGIIAARGVVVARIADELLSLKLTNADNAESIERRLGRTLGDEKLDPRVWFEPAIKSIVDWRSVLQGHRQVVLAVDESSKEDEVHLFRIGLPYWGHCLSLVWDVWLQNRPLSKEHGYWVRVDALLNRVRCLIPAELRVIVLADRAYDIPSFVDRIGALGWHWAVRLKARGSGWFRDVKGRETPIKELIGKHVREPGMRWKARGRIFKDAGWREASIVAYWQLGEDEPLVVISDLAPSWDLLKLYGVRYWIETGFRSDKKLGWNWEDSQVKKIEHHKRLLLGMAWASLVTLCIGLREAKSRLAKLHDRQPRRRNGKIVVGKPRPADQSLFTMGLRRTRDWLYHTADAAIQWTLTDLSTSSWSRLWYSHQSQRLLAQTVRP